MKEWQDIKIKGITRIEKCVAQFYIWELEKTPHAKFKVKILENAEGRLTGYTNIMLKNDTTGIQAVGYGYTIKQTLENTVNYFMEMLEGREDLREDDFEYCVPDEF